MPGTASAGEATGRVSAAAVARPVSSTINPIPSQTLRRDSAPAAAAAIRVTSVTVASKMGLSDVPNWATAYSFTGVGVASMTTEPTASTGEAAGFVSPATR
jgi:hypothetical protein